MLYRMYETDVSIHAPARGATLASYLVINLNGIVLFARTNCRDNKEHGFEHDSLGQLHSKYINLQGARTCK